MGRRGPWRRGVRLRELGRGRVGRCRFAAPPGLSSAPSECVMRPPGPRSPRGAPAEPPVGTAAPPSVRPVRAAPSFSEPNAGGGAWRCSGSRLGGASRVAADSHGVRWGGLGRGGAGRSGSQVRVWGTRPASRSSPIRPDAPRRTQEGPICWRQLRQPAGGRVGGADRRAVAAAPTAARRVRRYAAVPWRGVRPTALTEQRSCSAFAFRPVAWAPTMRLRACCKEPGGCSARTCLRGSAEKYAARRWFPD